MKIFYSILFVSFFVSCSQKTKEPPIMQVAKDTVDTEMDFPLSSLTEAQLYDKILGTLVGSAIGDAMGAPTEMWPQNRITREYGFVDSLDNMIRTPSPEGTWDYNLPAGGTTDDTRWKVLLSNFFIAKTPLFYQSNEQLPVAFSNFLVDQYQDELDGLKQIDSFDPAPFEQQMLRVSWLQEWAMVAKPFAAQDLIEYNDALSRFYGGEMVCAGLLYAPLLGAYYPESPSAAYHKGYELAIFDIGYARDISALSAAMVAAAFNPKASKQSVIEVLKSEDTEKYFKSRLVGRISYRIYLDALYIAETAKNVENEWLLNGEDSIAARKAGMEKAFQLLSEKNQDYPFHVGEIHLINLTALLVNDFAFRETMAFIVNYGRDNDTVAAVTGAILGAYYGFESLPIDLKTKVLSTNKNKLGIDLENIAAKLSAQLISNGIIQKTM